MAVGWYFHESYAKINDNSVLVDTPSNRCIAYIQIKWYTKHYVHGYWEIFIDMAVILITIESPKIYTMVLWIANEQVKSGLSGKRLIKMLWAWQSCILWKLIVKILVAFLTKRDQKAYLTNTVMMEGKNIFIHIMVGNLSIE